MDAADRDRGDRGVLKKRTKSVESHDGGRVLFGARRKDGADPDVILTNVNYIEDPVGEIMGRSGWDALSAVKNQQVYYVDNMASSLPNQNVVKALDQMAKAVYPEYYEG